MRSLHSIALVLASLLITSCAAFSSNSENEAMQHVNGAILFSDASQLPLKARIDVYLLDVTNADASAEVIDTRRLENNGRSPISFELHYDATAIDPSHTYTIRAAISLGEEFLYTAERRYPVITQGAGHYVSVRLVKLN